MTNHCFVNTLDFLVLQGHRSFNAAVSDWYSESNGYSYNGGISGAGHFTQMVSRFGVSADNFMIVFALCTMGGLTRGTPGSTCQRAQSAGHTGLMITIHPGLAPTTCTQSCCLAVCLCRCGRAPPNWAAATPPAVAAPSMFATTTLPATTWAVCNRTSSRHATRHATRLQRGQCYCCCSLFLHPLSACAPNAAGSGS